MGSFDRPLKILRFRLACLHANVDGGAYAQLGALKAGQRSSSAAFATRSDPFLGVLFPHGAR
jgi:hypothetical protein